MFKATASAEDISGEVKNDDNWGANQSHSFGFPCDSEVIFLLRSTTYRTYKQNKVKDDWKRKKINDVKFDEGAIILYIFILKDYLTFSEQCMK